MASASCYGAILSSKFDESTKKDIIFEIFVFFLDILWGVAYFYYKQIEPKYGDDEKIDGNEVRVSACEF